MARVADLTDRYYETRPGADALRYVLSYGFMTWLARRARKRPHRFFTELSSNIDRHILTEGLFEKGIIDLLRDVVTRLDYREIMIDVGANIGNHSVALGSLFERVEAVEPHPALFRVLTANVLMNDLQHVTCHNFGLASEAATGTLVEPVENHGLARVKERSLLSAETFGLTENQFSQSHMIELRPASDFLEQFSASLSKGFIKIDVEGMEDEIITAISPALKKYRPLVAFEWLTADQPHIVETVAALLDYELWGICSNDHGRNRLWRAMKLLFAGRSFSLKQIDPGKLDPVYPLALLVPSGSSIQ